MGGGILLRLGKWDLSRFWKRAMNYWREGYSTYISAIVQVTTNIMVLQSTLLSQFPIWLVASLFLSLFLPITAGIGKWNYKRGTYPELAEICTKSSEPAKDSYRAFLIILESLPETEEINHVKENIRRWI